jgi:NAD(P)-dependent dehydrogenase (short-subunit alcohol dehydrogenase family)
MGNKLKVLVVGGSGGLGSQLISLLREKYEVFSTTSSELNVTNLTQLQTYCNEVKPDVVINSSGVNFDSPLHKITPAHEDKIKNIINVNAIGNVNLLAACLGNMRENNFGRVILISSVLSTRSVFGTAIYSATKTFTDSLVRTASTENISKGITCNSIQLGYFDGGMCHRLPEVVAEKIKDTIGLKRWGSIKELYNTVDYLISTEYITGQNIEISGGLP